MSYLKFIKCVLCAHETSTITICGGLPWAVIRLPFFSISSSLFSFICDRMRISHSCPYAISPRNNSNKNKTNQSVFQSKRVVGVPWKSAGLQFRGKERHKEGETARAGSVFLACYCAFHNTTLRALRNSLAQIQIFT